MRDDSVCSNPVLTAQKSRTSKSLPLLHISTRARNEILPCFFQISVTELNRNETSHMTRAKSKALVMRQMVRTHYGGSYLVTVSSTGPNARPAPSVRYHAPEIPSPIQVHAFPDRNGSCVLYWTTPPDLPKEIKG